MKKYITVCLAFVLALLFSGCGENAVLEEMRVYPIGSDIHSLDIQIGAADFTIKQADSFSVESNLKYLSVTEKGGVLSVIDESKKGAEYKEPVLTIYMPTDKTYETIEIETGAGRLTADALAMKTLKFRLGAGDAYISNLIVKTEADIEGGAGKISVADGEIHDLELEMGVGELNLTAALLGDSELTFGVGESNVTLLGGEKEYRIDLEKGLGSITIDGKVISDSALLGDGRNSVEMQGGVGSINLRFQ